VNIESKEINVEQYLGAADVLEYVGSWPYVVPPVHRIKPGRLTQTDWHSIDQTVNTDTRNVSCRRWTI